jgi:fructuronate reductase
MQLNNTTYTTISDTGNVTTPGYDRNALKAGIVHLGLGAFHRAHQAVYTDTILNTGDTRWGIAGVSLRSADTRDALAPQDNLYTVAIRNSSGTQLRVVGALIKSLVAPENPQAVIDYIISPDCHIVSLTITEKGYCHDAATGTLQRNHPDIQHDIANIATPRTAIGLIVRALALRHQANLPPLTILSCDNLPANGHTTRKLTLAFAQQIDPALAQWIAQTCTFPNAMVDRIVPKTTDKDINEVATALGRSDAWPVTTEAFSQWIIEDTFAGPRPAWENAGATFVRDVTPYEHAKLRMLNGSHSALAYLGSVIGYTTVDQAIADPQLLNFLQHMLAEEVEPTLTRPNLPAYRQELMTRFANPSLQHRLQQIAMDGSQKLPQRILETIRSQQAANRNYDYLSFVIAAWFRYLAGNDEHRQQYAISDPLAATLQQKASQGNTPAERVNALLTLREVFGTDLPEHTGFVSNVVRHLTSIEEHGVLHALKEIQ